MKFDIKIYKNLFLFVRMCGIIRKDKLSGVLV